MTVATCANSTQLCPSIPARDYESANNSNESIQQSKNNIWTVDILGERLTLYQRTRDFTISGSGSQSWTSAKYIPDGSGGYNLCATYSGTSSGSVSENAIATDTQIFFLDPIMGVMFWMEQVQTCQFGVASSAIADFKGSWGYIHAHKLDVGRVMIDTVKTYYLKVGGVKEAVETVKFSTQYKEKLIFCFPNPPSLGIPIDPDIVTYGFYDYNEGGPEEALAKKLAEGGDDFYYPTWLQQMGIDKSMEERDAEVRFYAYYMQGGDTPSTITIPPTPTAPPHGNAVMNNKGEIALSFYGENVSVNRLYAADGSYTNITGLFDKPHIFPVGVV